MTIFQPAARFTNVLPKQSDFLKALTNMLMNFILLSSTNITSNYSDILTHCNYICLSIFMAHYDFNKIKLASNAQNRIATLTWLNYLSVLGHGFQDHWPWPCLHGHWHRTHACYQLTLIEVEGIVEQSLLCYATLSASLCWLAVGGHCRRSAVNTTTRRHATLSASLIMMTTQRQIR